MESVKLLKSPFKSESDKRDYRSIQLANGLKAVLIHKHDEEGSEKSRDVAAACITVFVGSFDDPPHVLGLAHFLEHLIFMGSGKYPKENSFMEFVEANGGYSNATTGPETTNYFFEVSTKAFPESLDRFANMFASPLLLKTAMQREREAVDSEYKMGLPHTSNLIESLHKSFIKSSHPASQFNCGNLKTLKEEITDDDLHREVLKFHKKYAANRSCLAIQSKLSLDEMQRLVVEKFSELKAESEEPSRKLSTSLDEIFKPDFYSKMLIMKPKVEKQEFLISWTLPSLRSSYKTDPLLYISTVFAYEGEGGLKMYLKDRQLIQSLYFSDSNNCSDYCTPCVRFFLTDLGAQNIDKILEAVFSYLLMLEKTPMAEHKRLFLQWRNMENIHFKYSDETSTIATVEDLSNALFHRDEVDIIRAKEFVFDEGLIRNTISKINQRKFNLLIITDKHQHFDKLENYYEVKYQEIDFPEAYQKLWDERKLNPDFYLEKENPFMADSYEILANEAETSKYPTKLLDDGVFEVWHKIEDKIKAPKVMVEVELLSNEAKSEGESLVILSIYVDMLMKYLRKKLSQTMSAGLSAGIYLGQKSIVIGFRGFNSKMDIMIDTTLKEINYFNDHISESEFDLMKAELRRNYRNGVLASSSLTAEVFVTALTVQHPNIFQCLSILDELTFEYLKEFMVNFFAKLKIKVFSCGNYTKSDTMKVVNILKNSINCQPLNGSYELKKRSYQVPIGSTVIRVKSLTPNDDNSHLKSYYEVGKQSLRTAELAGFLNKVLYIKAFDYLRNKEQLGYSVGAYTYPHNGIYLFCVSVSSQEGKNPYPKVQQKMENFLEIAKKAIEELTDEEFATMRDLRLESLAAKPTFAYSEGYKFWSEIASEEYIFNRKDLEIKAVQSLTKVDLQEFFKSFTQPDKIRKLTIQAIGNEKTDELKEQQEAELAFKFITERHESDENVITDIKEFISKAAIHPIVRFSIE